MKVTPHGANLLQLTRFGAIFPMNCYLVREDDGLTLIDTTMGGAASAILAAARSGGAPIRRIVLTHAHMDHAGSLDALHKMLPDAEVLATARAARFLRGDRDLLPGEPPGRKGSYQTCVTKPTREISEGEQFGSLRVVASPGHTPGHIALLDVRDRALIAGDAFQTLGGIAVAGVVRPLFPFVALGTWHLPTALTSAAALRALDPTLLAVGHGRMLALPGDHMDRAIATAQRKVGTAS